MLIHRFAIISQGLPQPDIDIPTRWNSTYSMLKKLLSFEAFSEEHLELSSKMTPTEWNSVRDLVKILEPVFIATQKLQSEQLYMGDFYKLWLELTLTIKGMTYTHSDILSNCLKKREATLLENHIVVSAAYLDPRVRRILLVNPINLIYARSRLKNLMIQIYNVSGKTNVSRPSLFIKFGHIP